MQLFPLRLIPDNTNFPFMEKRWHGFLVSVLAISMSFFFLFTNGLNWGIDFTGGVLMEVRTERPANLSELRGLFPTEEFGEVSLQNFGDAHDVMIRLEMTEEGEQSALVEKVKERLAHTGQTIDYRKIDYVGPTVGDELIKSGALAVTLAVISIVIYIWFRFEWQFGVGAILALIHDAIVVMGFFAISGIEFSLASIAALLTVLGYSVNDTVVIFDRIREIRRKYKKISLFQLVNKSINSTLSRTLLTSGVTLLSVIALVVLGGEVIRAFAAAILVGIIAGTHSSIYVAAPVLIYLPLPDDRPVEGDVKAEVLP